MPAVSKAQFRFMEAVKHGAFKKKGLSKDKASEFVDSTSYKELPEESGKWAGGYADGGPVLDPDKVKQFQAGSGFGPKPKPKEFAYGGTVEVGNESGAWENDLRNPEMIKLFAEALKKRKRGNL